MVWRAVKLMLWTLPPVLIGAAVATVIWFRKDVIEAEGRQDAYLGALRDAPAERYDFGLAKFDEAVELLTRGETEEARLALMGMLRYHRDSARAEDAMRLLGELNMDRLFDPAVPMPGKKRVEVQRGDSLAKIASGHQSTVHYIVRANGLARPEAIQPHDQLLVCPLDKRMVVRLEEGRVELMEGDRFFAVMALVGWQRPPGAPLPWKGEVRRKFGSRDGQRVLLTDPGAITGEKWIETTGDWGIRSHDPDVGDPKGYGVFVSPEDAADLMALLREGAVVEVNP